MAGFNAVDRFDNAFRDLRGGTETRLQHLVLRSRNAIQDAEKRGIDPQVLLFTPADHALLTAAMAITRTNSQDLFSLAPPPLLESSPGVLSGQVWVSGPLFHRSDVHP